MAKGGLTSNQPGVGRRSFETEAWPGSGADLRLARIAKALSCQRLGENPNEGMRRFPGNHKGSNQKQCSLKAPTTTQTPPKWDSVKDFAWQVLRSKCCISSPSPTGFDANGVLVCLPLIIGRPRVELLGGFALPLFLCELSSQSLQHVSLVDKLS